MTYLDILGDFQEFVPDFMDVSFGVVRIHVRSLGENSKHGMSRTQCWNSMDRKVRVDQHQVHLQRTKTEENQAMVGKGLRKLGTLPNLSISFFKPFRPPREQQEGFCFSKRGLRAPIGDSLARYQDMNSAHWKII